MRCQCANTALYLQCDNSSVDVSNNAAGGLKSTTDRSKDERTLASALAVANSRYESMRRRLLISLESMQSQTSQMRTSRIALESALNESRELKELLEEESRKVVFVARKHAEIVYIFLWYIRNPEDNIIKMCWTFCGYSHISIQSTPQTDFLSIVILLFDRSNMFSANTGPVLFDDKRRANCWLYANNQWCNGAGTHGNGVPTPFSNFAFKLVWSCFKMASVWVGSHTYVVSTTSLYQ